MKIRHVLPEFGRVPHDLLADSMSGIVRAAVTIATRQSRDLVNRVELLGLNRDMPTSSHRLERVEMWATRGLSLGRWNTMDWRYFLPLYIRSMRRSVDLLHVHDNPFLLSSPRANKRVVHFHTPISTRVNHAFVSNALKADRVICNSHYIRSDFLQSVPYPPENTTVVHNAVDFEIIEGGDSDLRARLGIDRQTKILLFVGQLSWQKGLIHLINALPMLADPTALIVAGGSDLWQTINDPVNPAAIRMSKYETDVREAAKRLPVFFLGTVPTNELKHVYASCDIFICPSEWPEPFGMVNVEAMAAGKPVIASHVGGIPEIVEDGETGLLVEPANPVELAKAITALLADDVRRKRMGQTGYIRARDYFNWDRVIAEVTEVYENA
ncbi:MAG: glycosyltransferase family 4 protein [Anaerolineales bacterium]|nr:glycosyltransferase family 4 protein [Anaerolineales bacterium]